MDYFLYVDIILALTQTCDKEHLSDSVFCVCGIILGYFVSHIVSVWTLLTAGLFIVLQFGLLVVPSNVVIRDNQIVASNLFS